MKLDELLGGVIALAFLFSVLSIIASGLEEWWSRLAGLRARLLECFLPVLVSRRSMKFTALRRVGVLLRSAWLPYPKPSSLVLALKAHPLIRGLRTDDRFPGSIPSANFAMALLDLTVTLTEMPPGSGRIVPQLKAPGARGTVSLERRERQLVRSLLMDDTNLRSTQARVEKWFNESIAPTTEYYKRIAQGRLILVSAVVAFALKIDALAIVSYAFRPGAGNVLDIPLGWNARDTIGPAIPGCIIAALAISQGAPFWFDLLNRFVNLRQTGVQISRGRSFIAD